MKKKALVPVLAVLIGFGTYLGYTGYLKNSRPSLLQATGTVEATQVELRAKVPGVLGKIPVTAGGPVKKGQLVADIKRNDLVSQRERDALGVLKAQAQLDDLVSGAREQEIRDAEIGVSTAQTNYEKAGKDYDRYKELFQAGAVPASEMDKMDTFLKQSQNQLDSAKSRLNLLRSGSRPDQIKAAQAEVERSTAVLKASDALLEDTKITCPIDGTVLSKNFEEGEFVQAGASVITVANLSDMWIKVYIPTDDLPKIKLGQEVKVAVSGSSEEFTGNVEEIATQGEFTPKAIQTKKERTNIVYSVKIRINSESGVLKPGMPADVTFI